jgi:ribonuclease HI
VTIPHVEYLDETALNIYTDGSSYSGPRRGGVGILFVTVNDDGDEVVDDYPLPGYTGATNNQMELQACVDALMAVATRRAPVDASKYRKIVVVTDSMYLVEGYDSARFTWPHTGWMTKEGNPVANAQLWKDLLRAASRTHKRVEFKWVKGHKKSPHNKRADALAKQSATQRTKRAVSVTKVRRKTSPRSVDIGSVQMLGQRLTIRIITDQYLRVQRTNRFKYEVVSRNSPFFQAVDVIYSDESIHLSAGHTYHVRVNNDTKRPRVVKLFREILPK